MLLVMTKKRFGCVGVINKSKKIIGIITDGDLRRNMKINIVNMKASQVMTKKPELGGADIRVSCFVGRSIATHPTPPAFPLGGLYDFQLTTHSASGFPTRRLKSGN